MAISKESRRSGPYVGTGTVKTYPFDFLMRNAEYVAVYQSVEGSTADRKLGAQEFSITLNPDQENNPGGTVTLDSALANGVNLSIVSEVPYTQNLVLTNKGGFYPESINDAEDERVIQIQQLYEALQRCVSIPVTSLTTREELLQQLMDVAAKANEYVQLAEKIYQEVLTTQKDIEELEPKIVASVAATRDDVVAAVTAEGDAQYERLQAIGDWAASQLSVSCQEATLTVSQAVGAGATVALPSGLRYLPSRKHMRVSWNGIVLSRGKHWRDAGTEDAYSENFTILVPLAVGDEVNVFIAPLGSEDFAEEIARITALEEALADLSQKVVYKDEGSSE